MTFRKQAIGGCSEESALDHVETVVSMCMDLILAKHMAGSGGTDMTKIKAAYTQLAEMCRKQQEELAQAKEAYKKLHKQSSQLAQLYKTQQGEMEEKNRQNLHLMQLYRDLQAQAVQPVPPQPAPAALPADTSFESILAQLEGLQTGGDIVPLAL